ncbi:MAG: hypothetical protein JWP73_1837, partial [Phenylobacterium sp.]|nr:hypothetical protein [Phenylobacterium sp.]
PHAMISVSKDLAHILFVCTHSIAEEQAAEVDISWVEPPPQQPVGRGRSVTPKRPIKRSVIRSRA